MIILRQNNYNFASSVGNVIKGIGTAVKESIPSLSSGNKLENAISSLGLAKSLRNVVKEKIFGQVKKKNKAKKKAWEARMAGINNPEAPMIIDNPDNPNKIKRYVMQEYNFDQNGDTKNSSMFRDMNQEIRSASDDLKVLNPEFVDNAERKSVFRKFNKSKKRSDKVLQAFNDEMDDIYDTRERVRKAVERKKKDLARLERNKKILKIGLPIVAGSMLIGGGLYLNKKSGEFGKRKEAPKIFSDREKVPAEIENKARKQGVIQKDSKGVWRIISLKTHPAEYWDAHYKTREDAEKALGAYHANK